MKSFLNSNNCTNLIKTNICFEGSGSCVDLILTNRKYSFQYIRSYETGLSDYHLLIYTMLKTTFIKTELKLLKYRCYKMFLFDIFKDDLTENLINDSNSYYDFDHIFTCQLDKHAILKKNWIRGNINPPCK